MIFEEILDIYPNNGCFKYRAEEDLASKCNAPRDAAGVYLIYTHKGGSDELVYIGSSGQKDKKGNLKIRNGGLYDRLVNGYHPNRFGQEKRIKRRHAFPIHMTKLNIDEIQIFWWVTYDRLNSDFPTDVEKILETKYLLKKGQHPSWHQRN